MENEKELLDLAKQATAGVKPQEELATPEGEEQAEAEPQDEQKPLETPEEDEKPIGEMLEEEQQEEGVVVGEEDVDEDEDESEEEMVPKATLLQVKKKLKDEIRSLKSKPTASNLDDIADSVAEKFNTDPEFVKEILAQSTGLIEQKFQKEIQQIKNKDKAKELEAKKNQLFDGLFEGLIAKNPDLRGVVNKDFIKKEALDPSNSKKTLKDIVKDIYGGAIETKKISLDGYKASKGEVEPENLLNADSQTQKEIASNPTLRKKFGEELAKRVNW